MFFITNRFLFCCIVVIIPITCCCWPTTKQTEDSPNRISVNSNGDFVDGYGRVRIFHGINSVKKGPPFYDEQILNVTMLSAYKDWGFNAVRLGTMWAGVYPAQGKVNGTYMKIMDTIIEKLKSFGLYSLLDMHQDVLTTKYGSYDGVPRWLVDMFPKPPLPYPWPFDNITAWADGYLTWAVSSAFQHLYRNHSNSLGHWSDFWTTIASAVKDKDCILGYELINEPWAGDVFGNPTFFLPGKAGEENLLPVYDVLSTAISKVDTKTIIFYEPVTWAFVVGGAGIAGTGFHRVPRSAENRSALSYHYYCWTITPPDETHKYPVWEELLCDAVLLQLNMENARLATQKTGGARFLTEFGICRPSNDSGSIGTIECDEVMKVADKNMQSWLYWDSMFLTDDGQFDWTTIRHFARTYPRATAGKPLNYTFDVNTGDFSFWYRLDPKVQADTEIFVPLSVHYPRGISVVTTPKLNTTLVENVLYIKNDNTFQTATDIHVAIHKQ